MFVERFLRAHDQEMLPERDPAIAAGVIVAVIEALTHRAIIDRREALRDGTLVRETFCVIASYVSRS